IPNSGLSFAGWYRDGSLLSKSNPYNYTTRGKADTIKVKFVTIPVAEPIADITEGSSPLTVRFDSRYSGDSYLWDFKDWNTSKSKIIEHTFAPGVYEIELTVRIGELHDTGSITITVDDLTNKPPIVSIISPINLSASFIAPAEIPITVAVDDPEEAITKVEFFANGDKIGESIEAPYSFIWHDVPVGTYYIQARAYDDVQYTNSLVVQVSVYDPTEGYKLGGILLSEYKIKPGRAPGSNLAIEGTWDMPVRTNKVHHEWPDENGVEPYLLPEEIFFAGRDITFHGILHAESDAEARE